MILKANLFLKSMRLNDKVFVNSMIFNWFFFVLSDFETTFLHRVRSWINFFYNRLDFEQFT